MKHPDIKKSKLSFPPGFLWGTATSPTQVEGDISNDWVDFVAPDNKTANDGPMHWRMYKNDIELIGDLNQNAYRMGVDWARLQPAPKAELDEQAMNRYLEILGHLENQGVEPFVTLFHFAVPKWLADMGGWANRKAAEYFADFAARVARRTSGLVSNWVTINEPVFYALMAYLTGVFPPHKSKRLDLFFRVLRNLERGHSQAYEKVKDNEPGSMIGITKHFKRYLPFRRWHPLDNINSLAAWIVFDRMGLNGFIRRSGRLVSDYVGVNYYGILRMKNLGGLSPVLGFTREELLELGLKCDDMWEQAPEYFPECLADVSERTGLPIFVTENGVATTDEELRRHYLVEHIKGCHKAVRNGVDVRGYFYWSLMDNFEWGEGYSKRFGLVEIDYDHPGRTRKIRPAGHLYAEIAEKNALSLADGKA